MLLQFISIELDAYLLNVDNQPWFWCCLCSNNLPYSLPCRHCFVEAQVIDIKDIYPRFHRSEEDNPALKHKTGIRFLHELIHFLVIMVAIIKSMKFWIKQLVV